MPTKINLINKPNKNYFDIYTFFCDLNNKSLFFDKLFSKTENDLINQFIKKKTSDNEFEIFNLNSEKKVIIIFLKKKLIKSESEILGAKFYDLIKSNKLNKTYLNLEENFKILDKDISVHFLHGFSLKSYEFNFYKTQKNNELITLNVYLKKNKLLVNKLSHFHAIEIGTNFARDLVSEPPNVLNPKEYVLRLLKLKKYGIKVSVYNEIKLKKMGMHSLLGVGRGSANESFLVTLEWYGQKNRKSPPLSFVGKGVCFDTGGISLKPAKFMEEMKYDMAGSAVVAGLIQSLAIRKAKVNAIGVVGLVENMPGGNAQRPGDIVKAFNGKTIEVLNTDAEGRLVLADALSFTEKKFKPKFIVDLATLTGAIIVALGEEYAGLFSNNDELSKKLSEAGEKVNEKVWRLPLHKNYDKLMDSTIADIQNINYSGGAGSITAAQFLQRFVEKTPWAHLDIAGMAFSKKAANLNPGGATGFGVRLLNQLIEDYYE